MILDMRPVCIYTDFFVIVTGRNPRQTVAIWDEVREAMKRDHGVVARAVEGTREGTWIVGDFLDVVLHVFTRDAREYYGLEDLWGDVPALEVGAVSA